MASVHSEAGKAELLIIFEEQRNTWTRTSTSLSSELAIHSCIPKSFILLHHSNAPHSDFYHFSCSSSLPKDLAQIVYSFTVPVRYPRSRDLFVPCISQDVERGKESHFCASETLDREMEPSWSSLQWDHQSDPKDTVTEEISLLPVLVC